MSHLLIVGGSDARIMAAYGQEIACRIDTEVSKRVENLGEPIFHDMLMEFEGSELELYPALSAPLGTLSRQWRKLGIEWRGDRPETTRDSLPVDQNSG